MTGRQLPADSWDKAREVLGVGANATDEQVRAAYLGKVREHPPDRDPEMFERVRDAYDQLRDPLLRARQVLGGPSPLASLPSLFEPGKSSRRFVGPGPWLDALKERRT